MKQRSLQGRDVHYFKNDILLGEQEQGVSPNQKEAKQYYFSHLYPGRLPALYIRITPVNSPYKYLAWAANWFFIFFHFLPLRNPARQAA